MSRGITVLLLLALSLPLLGSGKRGDSVFITFHLEAEKEEYPKFAQAVKMPDGQQYYFKLSPVLTDGNFLWYYPFLAEDGQTYGAAFKLDARGTNALSLITSSPENNGRLLATVIQPLSEKNPGQRKFLQIDKRITDGILVVWDGFNDQHLRIISSRLAHVRDVMGDQ